LKNCHEKATSPFTNDQYEILKKQFIADTLGQIQIVLDDRPKNEPLEKMNENFNEYLTHIARQPDGKRAYTRLSGFRSFCLCTTDFIF